MSSAEPAAQRLTWRQFASLDDADELAGVELVDGVLEEGEVPTRKHGRIITSLIMLLGPWLASHGGGELLSQDNRVRIAPRRVRKPDVLMIRKGDRPRFDQDTLVSSPFLVVEVVTKTVRDEHRDRVTKLADYEAIAARQYWIIDPELDRLEVYILGTDGFFEAPRIYQADDVVDAREIGLDDLTFLVGSLGAEL